MKAHEHTTKTLTTDVVTDMPNLTGNIPLPDLPRGVDKDLVELLDRRIQQHVQYGIQQAINHTNSLHRSSLNDLRLSLDEADQLTYRRRMWTYAGVGTVGAIAGVAGTLIVQRLRRGGDGNNGGGGNGR